MDTIRIFDQLIYNMDRSQENLLITNDWKVWMIDHTRAFRKWTTLRNPAAITHCNPDLLRWLKALRSQDVAREMGDLSENFEYKSARQRAEYLSARVGKLQSELSNVRVLDPAQIDTSAVRVGTKVALSNGDIRREVTILGPWESDP